MSSKYTEKVICQYCEQECLLKNLKAHNDAKHDRKALKYRSSVSRDISAMFGVTQNSTLIKTPSPQSKSAKESPSTIPKLDDVSQHEPGTTDENLQPPPSKLAHLATPSTEPETQALVTISKQIQALTANVQMLIDEKKDTTTRNVPKNEERSPPELNSEEKCSLINHARSMNSIMKWLDDWVLEEEGQKCTACGIVILYRHLLEGSEFSDAETLPRSFRNMKISVLRHLASDTHISSHTSFQNGKNKEREALNAGKQCGLNCASAAYTSIYFGESLRSYEHHIADIYAAGGLVGTKNHSTFFPRTFLPNVYDVIRSDISHFVVSNNLPFGLLADKMTTKYLTRHMVGIRIPVWVCGMLH